MTALIDPIKSTFDMPLRHSHNIFGWKAGDTLRQRGLCSGAIYRTETFMETEQSRRCGAKGVGKTVHIEHTVPIAELNKQWIAYRLALKPFLPTLAEAYAWMFVYSVCTAFHIDEQGGIHGYEGRTDAFDRTSNWFDRPFMRYTRKTSPPVIWNVLTEERIDPERWSFADNFAMIDKLFDLAECDQVEASLVGMEAEKMLKLFRGTERIAA